MGTTAQRVSPSQPNRGQHPDRFATPHAKLAERLRFDHIRRRLTESHFIGPDRMPLGERARIVGGQIVNALRLGRESMRAPAAFDPLFVVGNGRGGTTWVGTLLDSHPQIAYGGELWLTDKPHGLPLALMPKVASAWHLEQSLRRQARLTGCRYSAAKLLLHEVANRHFELDDLERSWPGARYVVVVRRHLGLQFVSLATAQATNRWVAYSAAGGPPPRVAVDLDWFARWRQMLEARLVALARHPIGERALWLVYEELDGRPGPAFDEGVWPYLGLPSAAASTPLRKQRRGTLAERVINFDEAGAELEGAVLSLETPGGRGFCIGPPGGLRPELRRESQVRVEG